MTRIEGPKPVTKKGPVKRFFEWLNRMIGPEVHDDDTPESFRDLADGLNEQRKGEW